MEPVQGVNIMSKKCGWQRPTASCQEIVDTIHPTYLMAALECLIIATTIGLSTQITGPSIHRNTTGFDTENRPSVTLRQRFHSPRPRSWGLKGWTHIRSMRVTCKALPFLPTFTQQLQNRFWQSTHSSTLWYELSTIDLYRKIATHSAKIWNKTRRATS